VLQRWVSEIIFGTGNTRRSIIINLWMIKRACDLTKSIVWATQTPLSPFVFPALRGWQAGRQTQLNEDSLIHSLNFGAGRERLGREAGRQAARDWLLLLPGGVVLSSSQWV
jgi:hypothetical protein